MVNKVIRGVFVPAVTPFNEDLSVDYKGFENMLSYFNENEYVDGLFIMGATGEYGALSFDERKHLIDISVGVEWRKKFILNVGSNNPETALRLAEHAGEKGADIIGVVIPQEYKTFDEVYRFFEKLSRLGMNIFLYQSGGNRYQPDVAEFNELLKLNKIAGIKDSCSSRDMYRHLRYIQNLGGRISVIQGVEMLYLSSLVMGADGVIGGGCNVYPFLLHEIGESYKKGDISQARKYQYLVNELIETVCSEGTGNRSMKYFLRLSGVELECSSRTEKDSMTRRKEGIIKKLYEDLLLVHDEIKIQEEGKVC